MSDNITQQITTRQEQLTVHRDLGSELLQVRRELGSELLQVLHQTKLAASLFSNAL